MTEFRVNETLQHLGVTCPAPVAAFDRLGGPPPEESYFVAVAVVGAQALGPYLEARFRAGDGCARKLDLIRRAMQTADRLHDQGLQHRDFHGGNLLLREAEGPAGRLYLIDSPRALDRGVVGARARAEDLADLLHSLRHALDPEELHGLFRSASRGDVTPALLQQAFETKRRRTQRSRAQRAFVTSGGFQRVQEPDHLLLHDRSVSAAQVRAWCAQHDRAVAAGEDSVLRYGSRSNLSVQPGPDEYDVLVKEYRADRRGAARRATTAWAGGVALQVRGIPTARPLALHRSRNSGASFVLSEALADAVPLHLLASRGDSSPRQRRRVAQAVGQLLARMIQTELVHDDLSAKNILVRDAEGNPAVFLVDWDAIVPDRPWNQRRLRRALSQIGDLPVHAVSRADRVRFVRELLRATRLELDAAALLRESWTRIRRRQGLPESAAP